MSKSPTVQAIKNRMIKMVSECPIKQLCEMFELTNTNPDEVIPVVRGILMDELEKRDPVTFNKWMNTENIDEMDHPSNFFK